MAKQARMRPIRFDQFKEQLEEVGIGNLQEVILSKTESVWIRLGNTIDEDDAEEFMGRLRGASESIDAAMVVLDYYPQATAEEQWALLESHGYTSDQLAALWTAATTDQKERLGELRPRRS